MAAGKRAGASSSPSVNFASITIVAALGRIKTFKRVAAAARFLWDQWITICRTVFQALLVLNECAVAHMLGVQLGADLCHR